MERDIYETVRPAKLWAKQGTKTLYASTKQDTPDERTKDEF